MSEDAVKELELIRKEFSESEARSQAQSKVLVEQVEAAKTETKKVQEELTAMRRQTRARRFSEVISGDGEKSLAWEGEPVKHLGTLEKLADTFGDESGEVRDYIELNQRHARQLKESQLFVEIGHSRQTPTGPEAELYALVVAKIKEGAAKNRGEAEGLIFSENPRLYQALNPNPGNGR